jgi:AcrR family transcriptional regulator
MNRLLRNVSVKIDESLFSKDPTTSDVGLAIIRKSVDLIHSEGLESFTFKKLATALGSTESTIYRYFLNKHQLMMYLASWYWNLLEWKIVFATANMESPVAIMDKALKVLSNPVEESSAEFFDEKKLRDIAISYGFNGVELKNLKKKERVGYFLAYSNLSSRFEQIILLHNKNYKNAKAMATTLIETSNFQLLLKLRLPELTDVNASEVTLHHLLTQMAYKALEEKK